jgi:uncharacterized protein
MLEQLNRINLLYDIYAPLLTGRQREMLQLYFSDNYSLGEIAADYNISRQAVYDLIQRSLASIEKLEEKLGLYRLFKDQQELLAEADQLLAKDSVPLRDLQRLKEIISELRSGSEQ